jgi:hypothetical protein
MEDSFASNAGRIGLNRRPTVRHLAGDFPSLLSGMKLSTPFSGAVLTCLADMIDLLLASWARDAPSAPRPSARPGSASAGALAGASPRRREGQRPFSFSTRDEYSEARRKSELFDCAEIKRGSRRRISIAPPSGRRSPGRGLTCHRTFIQRQLESRLTYRRCGSRLLAGELRYSSRY